MANHVRQQLREYVAGVVTGLATTGASVYQSRLYPLQETELPCIVVSTDGDRRQYLTENHPEQVEVEILMRIDGYAQATVNLDDTLDTISKEIEVAMSNASIADYVELAGTQIEDSAVGNVPVGVVSLAYRIKAVIKADAPDVVL